MNSSGKEPVIAFAMDFPSQFLPFIPPATLRIQTFFPDCSIVYDRCRIEISGPVSISENEIRKTVLHAVYREKIYSETLPMRQALVAAVTAR